MTSISFSSHGLPGHAPTKTASAWGIDPYDAGPRMDGTGNGSEARPSWLDNLVRLLAATRTN